MKLLLTDTQKDLKISRSSIEKAVTLLAASKRVKCRRISVHLVTKKKIAALHDQFFQDPTPTDCITFPIDDAKNAAEDSILGEIFICPRVAIEYAEHRGLDPRREFFLYLVHGFLHLLGYDDIDPADRRLMRRQEKACMHLLSRNNLDACSKKTLE